LPFDDPVSALRNIAEAIENIEQFTKGMDFEAFRNDLKTIAAVERKLLVISEAAIRLKGDAARLCPGPPWAEIRGMGQLAAASLRPRRSGDALEHRAGRLAAAECLGETGTRQSGDKGTDSRVLTESSRSNRCPFLALC
jgi:hypothetical protein